ncbi:MAG: helix-turn-helix domain-containing protein [Alloalcanivorax venustensis]|jgi:AraC-like DNA-binding protein|uniref:helix-turn-helix domain-containing protein n=1 Tax=Alloalcanivorax venustensis TaxID=172371 RepID=UPI001BD6618E|nr:MAG: helix-turn-helix domain-containing protein [Alcanivorax sp.]
MAIQRLLLSGQPAPVFKETVETFYEATGCKVEHRHLGKGQPWVDLRLRPLHGLWLVDAESSPYCNKVLKTSEHDCDLLKLGIALRGEIRSEQDGADVRVCRGRSALIAADRVGSIEAPGLCRTLAVAVPRERLAVRLDHLDQAMRQGLGGCAEMRLLESYVLSLMQEQTEYSRDAEARVSEHLCDLVNLLLGAGHSDAETGCLRGARAARLALLKSDIAANLGNSELSLDWLARRHGLGRRAIRNLFYAEGTNFTDYVLNQRLDLTHALLTAPAHRHRSIIAIAMEAGFGDVSWFNRAFRRQFGRTPKEARDLAMSPRA